MTELPAPPVPLDLDLRMLDRFNLDATRLLGSSLFAMSTGEEFKAWMALLMHAWHQLPAGSLPNDERKLAGLSGAGPRWKKLREMALYGWVLHSDGRLYHPVLCEDALRARKSQEEYQGKKAATAVRVAEYRAKKAAEEAARRALQSGDETPAVTPDVTRYQTPYVHPIDNRQGTIDTSSNEEENISLSLKSLSFEEQFDAWWKLVPRKVGKGDARKAFADALLKENILELMEGARRWAWSMRELGREAKFIPHPASWLQSEGWTDEVVAVPVMPATVIDYAQKEADIAAAWQSGNVSRASLLQATYEKLIRAYDGDWVARQAELRDLYRETGQIPPIRQAAVAA